MNVLKPQGMTPADDRGVLRIGAVAAIAGLVGEIVAQSFHAGHSDPNDSVRVFQEYAASPIWTTVHLAQLLGAIAVAVALLAVARALLAQPSGGRVPALISALAVLISIATFAVQMAVDGVVLKETIASWLAAPSPADKAAAFYVADGVRWLEKALGGMFQILNGTALVGLGLAMLVGRRGPWPLAIVGIVAGFGFVAGGYVTEHTGFSSDAGAFLGPAALFGAAFLVGAAAWLWRLASARRATHAVPASVPVGSPAA
jgi:hypothetical protein